MYSWTVQLLSACICAFERLKTSEKKDFGHLSSVTDAIPSFTTMCVTKQACPCPEEEEALSIKLFLLISCPFQYNINPPAKFEGNPKNGFGTIRGTDKHLGSDWTDTFFFLIGKCPKYVFFFFFK